MELIFLHRKGSFVKDWDGKDVHTKDGILPAAEVKRGGVVKAPNGEEYLVIEPTMRDKIQKARRGARPVYEYDAGLIAALLSIDKDTVVLEAGTGSGCATRVFANQAKRVESYEKEEKFHKIAERNLADVGNVKLHNQDLLDAELGDYGAVFLDMQHPEKGVEKAAAHLMQGRFIAVFTPIVDDVKPVVRKLEELGFIEIRIIQLDLKEMVVKKYLRVNGLFGFPGFVVVARRFR